MRQGTLREGLTSLPGGSRENHASLFPMQENEKEQTTAVTSGLRCLRLSEGLNRPMWLAKTLLASSVWRMAKHLTQYSLIWRMKATPRNRLLFQLVPSERGTEETEFGLLPTSQARDYKGADMNQESKRFSKKAELNSYVAMLPTPSANEDAAGRPEGNMPKMLGNSPEVRNTGTGTLNPLWVEGLMGYPFGYTDIQ